MHVWERAIYAALTIDHIFESSPCARDFFLFPSLFCMHAEIWRNNIIWFFCFILEKIFLFYFPTIFSVILLKFFRINNYIFIKVRKYKESIKCCRVCACLVCTSSSVTPFSPLEYFFCIHLFFSNSMLSDAYRAHIYRSYRCCFNIIIKCDMYEPLTFMQPPREMPPI